LTKKRTEKTGKKKYKKRPVLRQEEREKPSQGVKKKWDYALIKKTKRAAKKIMGGGRRF